ncbi:hypothetical protein AAVH_23314 [Aphelenchoides avenae]|nr:hypothetical protein AAVH_23314 [Aphelenchus avenae]
MAAPDYEYFYHSASRLLVYHAWAGLHCMEAGIIPACSPNVMGCRLKTVHNDSDDFFHAAVSECCAYVTTRIKTGLRLLNSSSGVSQPFEPSPSGQSKLCMSDDLLLVHGSEVLAKGQCAGTPFQHTRYESVPHCTAVPAADTSTPSGIDNKDNGPNATSGTTGNTGVVLLCAALFVCLCALCGWVCYKRIARSTLRSDIDAASCSGGSSTTSSDDCPTVSCSVVRYSECASSVELNEVRALP